MRIGVTVGVRARTLSSSAVPARTLRHRRAAMKRADIDAGRNGRRQYRRVIPTTQDRCETNGLIQFCAGIKRQKWSDLPRSTADGTALCLFPLRRQPGRAEDRKKLVGITPGRRLLSGSLPGRCPIGSKCGEQKQTQDMPGTMAFQLTAIIADWPVKCQRFRACLGK